MTVPGIGIGPAQPSGHLPKVHDEAPASSVGQALAMRAKRRAAMGESSDTVVAPRRQTLWEEDDDPDAPRDTTPMQPVAQPPAPRPAPRPQAVVEDAVPEGTYTLADFARNRASPPARTSAPAPAPASRTAPAPVHESVPLAPVSTDTRPPASAASLAGRALGLLRRPR